MNEQTVRSKSDILTYIKSLTSIEQSGEVLVHNQHTSGKVYLRDGHIAWAFAAGQRESFQSILIGENEVSREQLVDGIQQSREAGKRDLDDILAFLGIKDEAKRLLIIQRHTKAALEAMSTWDNCTIRINSDKTSPDHIPESTSTTENQKVFSTLESVLAKFQEEIPGFLAAVVVDGQTGMPIQSLINAAKVESEIELETVSAYYLNVIRSAHDALIALGKSAPESNPIQEIIITSKKEYVVLRVLREGAQMFYLLQDHDGNPGTSLIVIRRYLKALTQVLS